MARLDFFAFFPAHFMGSEAVKLMTMAERGAYITLLCHAWENGGLPASPALLSRIVGASKEEVVEMMEGPLGECWEERDGRLVNPRQEEERERAIVKSGAAKQAAEKRWARKKAAVSPEAIDAGAHANADANACAGADAIAHADAVQPQCERSTTVALPQDKTRQEHSLTTFESETRAREGPRSVPGEGDGSEVPQPHLEAAIAEQLEPLPPGVEDSLRELGAHVGERTGRKRGKAHWRGVVAEARKDPPRFRERVAFTIDRDAKNLLAPSDAELADWRRGRAESPPGASGNLGARANLQRKNRDTLQAIIDRERSEAAAERVLDVEPPPRLVGRGGASGQQRAAQAEMAL